MKLHNHLSDEQFELLLRGEPDDHQLQQVSQHLDSCDACQQKLDAMAADPQLWAKAPRFLSVSAGLNSTMNHAANDQWTPKDQPSDGWEFDSVSQLLDPPSHPEMLGRIGNYDVEREVGRGGMGIVFKAYDTELNRPLAVKIMAPWLARNGTARERFGREARAAAAILHPNVVSIYGVSTKDKTPYLVMPYVAGPSLQRLIDDNGPLGEKDVVRMALQVSAGLAAAHAQGLVHRDIKPANILVEADVSRVLVTDFGLARAVDDASATQSGYFVGTPNYMSPEQARGQRVDGRSDLFSLGSLIYFMSTGRMPFRAESPLCVLNRITTDEPTSVRQVNSDVSKTLSDIISRLLEKKPEHRFQTSSEVHDVLEKYLAYLHQPDISKPPVIISPRRRENPARSSLTKMLLALVALVVIGLLASNFGKHGLSIPSFLQVAKETGDAPPEGTFGNSDDSDELTLTQPPATDTNAQPAVQPTGIVDDEWGTNENRLDLGSGGITPSSDADSKWKEANAISEGGVPGKLVTVKKSFTGKTVDGYTIYLPRSYKNGSRSYPVLMCLQGGSSVGGKVSKVEKGLHILLHKSHDPRTDLAAYLQDSFIFVSPHIKQGEYYNHPTAIKEIVDDVLSKYRADKSKIYLSGISRGGSGVWGLASRIPKVFAAVAPLAGGIHGIKDERLLASIPMWVAHNTGDGAIEFAPVSRTVEKLEKISIPFHRVAANKKLTPDDLAHSKVFVVGESKDHDAWSGAYNNIDFYKWLLKHQLNPSR
jgi:serine/threonine-protein kinase